MAFLRHVALRVKDKEETRRFYEMIDSNLLAIAVRLALAASISPMEHST